MDVHDLPTALYTVIRPRHIAGWRLGDDPEILTEDGWERIGSDEGGLDSLRMAERLDGFEVLSPPVPDPRIARIEALTPIYVDSWDAEAYDAEVLRAILRGYA